MSQAPQNRPSSDDAPPHRYTAALAGQIEAAHQSQWAATNLFQIPNPGEAGFDFSRPKFYCLDMFPYPSGAGLHIGHPEGYTATDIISRYKRMSGYNLLHPMGWDAFGLPAEQYAIQTGVHPAQTTAAAIGNFRRQLQRFGFCYDWSREFGTIDESFYKWTQWIFLQLYNAYFDPFVNAARPISHLITRLESGELAIDSNADLVTHSSQPTMLTGENVGTRLWHQLSQHERDAFINSQRLAYLGSVTVNWCPKLGTVLANDEVIDGRSERGGHPVLRKPLKQWMFRITSYAQRLLDQLADLNWPSSTKLAQADWIGRSEGAEIDFDLLLGYPHSPSGAPGSGNSTSPSTNPNTTETDPHSESGGTLRVFTTRPDTIFGATYMVVAPEHELCQRVLSGSTSADPATVAALRTYVNAARNRSDVERQESKQKSGVFTGVHAINPATGCAIPVWCADYVLMGYGTGAIMAVPAHDERDWEFATTYGLPIIKVVDVANAKPDTCSPGEGLSINSSNSEISLNGLSTADAKTNITTWLTSTSRGCRTVNFKLRDWTFSRQRYWGEPFPIVYTDDGRAFPVSDAALPVKLPDLADYAPIESDDPLPLLAKATTWARTTAGAAGVDPALLDPSTPVTRECNTMPGSAGSSWYMLRYCDPHNAGALASDAALSYWMGSGTTRGGVDLYLGGSEHAVGHLLYSRFWTNVLFDLGHCPIREPFHTLFHQGLITSFAYQRPDKTIVAVDEVQEVSEGSYVEIATGGAVSPIVVKMSKRYKNVVNPDDVINEFGADTCRLYEMYMGPLEASKPWNPRDIVGCFRFLQRVWRNMIDESTGLSRVSSAAPDAATLRQLHKTIKAVRHEIESLGFNTAIAKLIELNNALGALPAVPLDIAKTFILLLSPFAPHIADELWQRVVVTAGAGKPGPLLLHAYPVQDDALTIDNEVELPIMSAGKVRARITVPTNADPKSIEAAAMAHPDIIKLLSGNQPKKVVVVPGKMVNLVL